MGVLIVVFSDIGIAIAGLNANNFTGRGIDTIDDDSFIVRRRFFLVKSVGRKSMRTLNSGSV